MADTARKTIKFWHEQYHEEILIFPDDLKVAKGAVTKEMASTNRELFKVQFSKGIGQFVPQVYRKL